ncbi:MAG: hypothetical protein NTZ17_11695 [Phycisphaerae bacterium]|nr:hypothetical protein [Phycisphaerae bacterium]
MGRSIVMYGVVLMAAGACRGQIPLSGDAVVRFASVDEGREILTKRDDFIRALSPFDRAARVKTDREVSEKEFLEFVGRSVLDWSDAEKASLVSSLDRLKASFGRLALAWPKVIYAVKTTGDEEGGAPYTRGCALILPKGVLTPNRPLNPKLLSHELFHILSRTNPGLRDRLYQAIGFERCTEIEFPEMLKGRKITNPDAPANDHCIRVRVAGADVWAVPILFSRTDKYDVNRGGEFFQYMQFQLLLVERPGDSPATKPIYEGSQPRLVEVKQVTGFYEQVGKNTQYIVHPEEILADNFADLVMQDRQVPAPEILTKMQGVLTEKPAPERK